MLNIDLLDHSCWITRYNHEIRYVFCDDATSADSNPTTDSHAGTDHNVSSKPAVLTNSDWGTKLRAVRAVAEERVKWVGCSIESTIWSNESACADGDEAGVQEDGVEIYVNVFTDSAKR